GPASGARGAARARHAPDAGRDRRADRHRSQVVGTRRRPGRSTAAESQPETRVRLPVTSRLLACSFVTFLVPALAAAQPARPAGERLSLDAAVRMAVESNRPLQASRLQVKKAEDDLAAARTRRLPAFETTMTASQLVTPVEFS